MTGPRVVVVADGPGTPTVDPIEVARAAGIDEGTLILGWLVDERHWIAELGTWRTLSYQPANSLIGAAREGRVGYLPIRLAAMPSLLCGRLTPELSIVPGVPRGDGFAFTENVGYADTAARRAARVVVQVVDAPDVGAPTIEGRIVEVVEGGERAGAPPVREVSELEGAIAHAAASMIPTGATIQYGLGKLPEAVVQAITSPVSVLSGLVTDAVSDLAGRGLLVGQVLASYAWGDGVRALARSGGLRPVGLEELHRCHRLAATPRFVAINTALEVGLDGSVNVERAGNRLVAGIGGHADYCAAAVQSEGGVSIIVLPSAHGERSSIVPVPAVVSTPRADIGVVVTEHGVADLRGLDERGRRRAMLAIADPAHRARLEREAADSLLA